LCTAPRLRVRQVAVLVDVGLLGVQVVEADLGVRLSHRRISTLDARPRLLSVQRSEGFLGRTSQQKSSSSEWSFSTSEVTAVAVVVAVFRVQRLSDAVDECRAGEALAGVVHGQQAQGLVITSPDRSKARVGQPPPAKVPEISRRPPPPQGAGDLASRVPPRPADAAPARRRVPRPRQSTRGGGGGCCCSVIVFVRSQRQTSCSGCAS
jgi:hypothetical protein